VAVALALIGRLLILGIFSGMFQRHAYWNARGQPSTRDTDDRHI
jgi:hypothetical protein